MLTDEIIAELKAKHGAALMAVPCPSGEVVFRRPHAKEWEQFQDGVRTDKTAAACRVLQSACVVYPDANAWRAAIEEEPALLTGSFQQAINELAGVDREDRAPRKL